MEKKIRSVEYRCMYCGKRVTRGVNMGRPLASSCPARDATSSGKKPPHRWEKIREF